MSPILSSRLAIVLLALAAVCGLPVVAAVYAARSPDYQCVMAQILPNGAVRERGATGNFQLWPLGLECRYENSSGERLAVSPGWFVTGLATASLTALLAAVAVRTSALVRAAKT
ncbi:hypothetical protein [Cryobacterium sp. CG_9.6]|uniref:hypothetical protein n=1 Tax=Cryobacterium sp. CG_9.6 TaxID=2760710 RepID=UPI002475D09A|nr:hypothetical protein [Cryobacterium sp. CG_9.6]MDH6237146.1 hypothetical protein [Cryobacterium sp. CG_9.6]